jgi:hypothetical protein
MPDGLEYSVGYRGVTITGYSGNATFLAIPGKIQGLPVTAIGEFAFFNCSSLLSVKIPSSVTSIGAVAFWGCSSLTSVNIPSSVTSIGGMTFAYCSSLASITVDRRNPTFASIDGVLFDKAIRTLIQYPNGKRAGTYAFPPSVIAIGDWAFAYSSNLTSMVIPSSIRSIGNGAFSNCDGLTDITMPSLEVIGNYMFAGCSSLVSINIPASVTIIGSRAFDGCGSLTSINIPSSVRSIGDDAFRECSSLTSVTLSRQTWFERNAFPDTVQIRFRD